MIYLVDFEASSLLPGSFPIEVAWVSQSGQGEHYLIRPHPEWLEGGCPGWSREAEAIHGISLDSLVRDGTPIERVAARAAKVLLAPGAVAYADQPEWDGEWLDALLGYGGVHGRIGLADVTTAYGEACRPLLRLLPPVGTPDRWKAEQRVSNLAAELVARAQEQEGVRGRTRHRALPDAESLWRTWRTVGELVAAWLAEEGER